MSSLTNENTNEMPINNRPTFEPNKHYYYYDDAVRELGYRGILCIKVDKKTKSGKSIWVMGKYFKIRYDERGEYFVNPSLCVKVYAADTVFLDGVELFTEGFANVLQKVETDVPSFPNFILYTHSKILSQNFHFVGPIQIQQDTPTAKDYTYQILETVEEFKVLVLFNLGKNCFL